MTDPLYAGDCVCGRPIMRRVLSGVAPKKCDECRSDGAIRRGRDAGPPTLMRRWMRETRTDLERRQAGSPHDLMRECAAVAMSETLGLPDDLADSILCAIDALVRDGETGLMIRRRLNQTSFGLRRAAEMSAHEGLAATIMSFGKDHA